MRNESPALDADAPSSTLRRHFDVFDTTNGREVILRCKHCREGWRLPKRAGGIPLPHQLQLFTHALSHHAVEVNS